MCHFCSAWILNPTAVLTLILRLIGLPSLSDWRRRTKESSGRFLSCHPLRTHLASTVGQGRSLSRAQKPGFQVSTRVRTSISSGGQIDKNEASLRRTLRLFAHIGRPLACPACGLINGWGKVLAGLPNRTPGGNERQITQWGLNEKRDKFVLRCQLFYGTVPSEKRSFRALMPK